MSTTYVIVTVLTIVANVSIASADFARARFVLGNMAEVGIPKRRLPLLAVLKLVGAAGLVLGLLGVPVVGVAAATGLVLLFACAVAVHLRARVFHSIAWPGSFLALALASLVLAP
ncbi:DoxX family protein [Streptomyces fulvoviolaceus]|uniref:DoxX family protein n=1 Tax=Streptomyces fulvoviolaceus TaxID=285535 RepID=UPI0004C82456|nr:DoxX family protein [Streptomyces fulvoviolaceus]